MVLVIFQHLSKFRQYLLFCVCTGIYDFDNEIRDCLNFNKGDGSPRGKVLLTDVPHRATVGD